MSRTAPLQFDITNIASSAHFLRTVYYEISLATKHTRACIPSGNDMPKLHANLIKKMGISENAWVGCPGIVFFGESSPKPLLLHQYFFNMDAEKANAARAIPLYPIPVVGPSDFSHLGIYRSMVTPNDKVVEEFYNEFAVALQIVQYHCSEATRDKLVLNDELETAIMRNDIVHYLYELKLACIRGGDTGANLVKDYEDKLLKPLLYNAGMAFLHGGGEGAYASYASAFKQGVVNCKACYTLRSDAEFIKGFVSGLHEQFDSEKRALMKIKTLDGVISAGLDCCRSNKELGIAGWTETAATNVGSKRPLSETNTKQTTTPAILNPSGSAPTVRTASISRSYPGDRGNYRGYTGSSASGGGLYRSNSNSNSNEKNGTATAQVFAINIEGSDQTVEVCFSSEDLSMVSEDMLRAAEISGEQRAYQIFHTGLNGSGRPITQNKICHEWNERGECIRKTHKYNGEFFLPCHYDHPEIGPNFQPKSKTNK